MSRAKFLVKGELRVDQGKGASRRLRRLQDKIPAILYGGGEAPANIALDQKKTLHALENPAFFSHLLTLQLGDDKQQVVLKAVQRHHFKKTIMHMDFQRVKPTDVIHMKVPIHFFGEELSKGVEEGGVVNHRMIDLEVKCQAQHLPEKIDVDLSHMVMDQVIHISDMKLPKGVESVQLSHGPEHDLPVVSIHLPRKVEEEEVPAPVAEGEVPTVEGEKAEADKAAKEGKDKAAAAGAKPQAGGEKAKAGGEKPKEKGKGK